MLDYAYDTEAPMVPGFDQPITATVQLCSLDALHPSAVEMIVRNDNTALDVFLDWLEDSEDDLRIFTFNLDYEWSRLESFVLNRYTWWEPVKVNGKKDWKAMPNGSFYLFGDRHFTYQLIIKTASGNKVMFYDDWQHWKCSMKEAGMNVYTEHPEWWPNDISIDDVKMEIDRSWYNENWTDPNHPHYFEMMEYSRRDAYTQAMIARYGDEKGFHTSLTSSSFAMNTILKNHYMKDGKQDKVRDNKRLDNAKKYFQEDYPTLGTYDESMVLQHYVEDRLVGGLVYGVPGIHKGVFTHIDYKSSYPTAYVKGRLFKGQVNKLDYKSDYQRCQIVLHDKRWYCWVVVSFDFDGLTPAGLPLISGKEVMQSSGNTVSGAWNKKYLKGHIENALYTTDYWTEIQKHYNLFNVIIKEVWTAPAKTGDFANEISEEYFLKEVNKGLGLKAESDMHKRNMNGGLHGKTITKTRRENVTYENGYKEYKRTENVPDYCALIGFSAMQDRRASLARDCYKMQEAGHRVLMNDTDSMVVEGTPEEIRAILGEDNIANEHICDGLTVKEMVKKLQKENPDASAEEIIEMMRKYKDSIVNELGKFEIETDKEGNECFDEFRCWGLKRYLELNEGKPRKSAFSGMSDRATATPDGEPSLDAKGKPQGQFDILMNAPCDGTEFSWHQEGMKKGEYGKYMVKSEKHARMEDIYYRDVESIDVSDAPALTPYTPTVVYEEYDPEYDDNEEMMEMYLDGIRR